MAAMVSAIGSSGPTAMSSRSRHVLTVTMNRPAKKNALSGPMLQLMSEAWDLANSSEAVRVVILTGAGGVEQIIEIKLTEDEQAAYRASFTPSSLTPTAGGVNSTLQIVVNGSSCRTMSFSCDDRAATTSDTDAP